MMRKKRNRTLRRKNSLGGEVKEERKQHKLELDRLVDPA